MEQQTGTGRIPKIAFELSKFLHRKNRLGIRIVGYRDTSRGFAVTKGVRDRNAILAGRPAAFWTLQVNTKMMERARARLGTSVVDGLFLLQAEQVVAPERQEKIYRVLTVRAGVHNLVVEKGYAALRQDLLVTGRTKIGVVRKLASERRRAPQRNLM